MYMGRMRENRRAFRFILNKSRAIAANVYLTLYPKALLARMLRESPELLQPVRAALGAIPSPRCLLFFRRPPRLARAGYRFLGDRQRVAQAFSPVGSPGAEAVGRITAAQDPSFRRW